MITRLDAKTLVERKAREGGGYMPLLQRIAFTAMKRQAKDLSAGLVEEAMQSEGDAALWKEVQASVKKGQFAVLTFFVEDDDIIHRYSHLSFQEHLCSMVLRQMLDKGMAEVVAIMTNGNLTSMLKGSWWLNTLQFLVEGLSMEGEASTALTTEFVDHMLKEVVNSEGIVSFTREVLHSRNAIMAFSELVKRSKTVKAIHLGKAEGDSEEKSEAMSAEWLELLCGALKGHTTLTELRLLRMDASKAPDEATAAGMRALGNLLCGNHALKVLHLESCKLQSKHVTCLFGDIGKAPIKLKELSLKGNKIDAEAITILSEALCADGVALEVLDLGGAALSAEATAALANGITAVPTLKTLTLKTAPLPLQDLRAGARINLEGLGVQDDDILVMRQLLSAMRASGPTLLEALLLSNNVITYKGAATLASWISTGALRVEELHLRSNAIGPRGVKKLVEAMASAGCPLKVLDLSEARVCGIDDAGRGAYSAEAVSALCTWLKAPGNSLQRLNLGSNQLCGITWAGLGEYSALAVDKLCEALVCPECQLVALGLYGNSWSDADGARLATTLEAQEAVKDLDMRWNELGSATCERLMNAVGGAGAAVVRTQPQRYRCSTSLNELVGDPACSIVEDEVHLYASSDGGKIVKWRQSDLHVVQRLPQLANYQVSSLKLVGDELWSVAEGRPFVVRVWKMEGASESLVEFKVLEGHKDDIFAVDASMDAVYTGANDKLVICWSRTTYERLCSYEHSGAVKGVVSTTDPSTRKPVLFVGESNHNLTKWDTETRKKLREWRADRSDVMWYFGMCAIDTRLFTGCRNGSIHAWDVSTCAKLQTFLGHTDQVYRISTQDGLLYSCSADSLIKVWDLNVGCCIGTMQGHQSDVLALCPTSSGSMYSADFSGLLKVWKEPSRWGEEWAGLTELDLTRSGMVAEDVERLAAHLQGGSVGWRKLVLQDNRLEDEGINRLVHLLSTSSLPLEELNLSGTGMTSTGLGALCPLLAEGRLPLEKLALARNDGISADGYAMLGTALGNQACRLAEIALMEDATTYLAPNEVKHMDKILGRVTNDAEIMVIAKLLDVGACASALHLEGSSVTSRGACAIAAAITSSKVPVESVTVAHFDLRQWRTRACRGTAAWPQPPQGILQLQPNLHKHGCA